MQMPYEIKVWKLIIKI